MRRSLGKWLYNYINKTEYKTKKTEKIEINYLAADCTSRGETNECKDCERKGIGN